MTKTLMSILWPAFLVAGVADGLFFSAIDPHDLHWFGEVGAVSRQGAYTLGFFFFWAICALSAALSFWLSGGRGAASLR